MLQHYVFLNRPISWQCLKTKGKKRVEFFTFLFGKLSPRFHFILIIFFNGVSIYFSSRSFVNLRLDRSKCRTGSVSSFPRHSIGQAHHRCRSYLHRADSKPPISITDTAPLLPVTGLEQRCYHDVAETITVD